MADVRLQAILSAKDEMSGTVSKAGSSLTSFAKIAAGATLAAGALAIGVGVSAVKAFTEAEVVQKKLEKVILNHSGATLNDVKALNDQAQALQKVGVVSADATTAAQAQLATFDFTSETIQKVIPGFLEYAVAERGLGVDANTAKELANGLGKAMQGNTELFTKSGFVISDAQKNLLKFGDEQTRAATIANILGNTYKGLNEETRKTFSGQMVAAKFTLNDLMQTIGKFIAENLTPVIAKFNEWSQKMGGAEGIFNSLKNTIIGVYNFLKPIFQPLIDHLSKDFQDLANKLRDNRTWLEGLKISFLAIGVVIVGAIYIIGIIISVALKLIGVFIQMIEFSKRSGEAIISAFRNAESFISGFFNRISGLFSRAFNIVIGVVIPPSVKGTINTLIRGINLIPGMNIPFLAKGGIVTKPTLAMIGENGAEAVVPLDRAGGMGKMIEVNFNNISVRNDDDKAFFKKIVEDVLKKELEKSRIGV